MSHNRSAVKAAEAADRVDSTAILTEGGGDPRRKLELVPPRWDDRLTSARTLNRVHSTRYRRPNGDDQPDHQYAYLEVTFGLAPTSALKYTRTPPPKQDR